MDILAFIAAVIGSVVWPATLITAVLLLRRPLAQLIPTITSLRYKELAIEFGRRVEDVAVEAAEVSEALPAARVAVAATASNRLLALADSSPRLAILEAWLALEGTGLKVVQHLAFRAPPLGAVPQSPNRALLAVERSDLITEAARATIKDLRNLRNEAVHYPDFALTEEAARTYVKVVEAIIDYLESLRAA